MTDVKARVPRAELVGHLDAYLEALRRRDPRSLDLSRLVRFTENAQELPVGLGLWTTAESVAEDLVAMVVDETAGTVVAITWVHEADAPVMLTVRLATEDGKITEIETIASRATYATGVGRDIPDSSFVRRTVFDEEVPPGRRTTRWALARATNLYFESIERGEPVVAVADDCVRHENGMQMTLNPGGEGFPDLVDTGVLGMSVAQQMRESNVSKIVERARDRRFAAIDETRGTVAVFFFFDHRQFGDRMPHPNSLYAGELFKHVDGEIVKIDAGFEILPFGTRSGWE